MADSTNLPEKETIELLAELVCMVYHEGRNIRFAVRAKLIAGAQFTSLIKLPKNREDAWIELSSYRIEAAQTGFIREVFETAFGNSLEELAEVYEKPIWGHSLCGGNNWSKITQKIHASLIAHEQHEYERRDSLLRQILAMSHNTGIVSQKLAKLRDLKK